MIFSCHELSYLLRYLSYALATRAKQSPFDYRHFSYVKLNRSAEAGIPKSISKDVGKLLLKLKGQPVALDEIVKKSDTLSFLVLKNGRVVYQYYDDKVDESTPLLAYSVTKSIFSAYLGHLVDSNIFTVEDKLSKYHSNLPGFLADRTVQSLMNMESGIQYTHGKSPFTDMARFWLSPDVRKDLQNVKPASYDDIYFLYNDIHLHLMYRLADRRVSDIPTDFKQAIWEPLGMSHDGYFCVDNLKSRCLKVDGGLAITAQDMAKIGLLHLNNGMYNGRHVIPEAWCKELKSSENVRRDLKYWDLYRQMNHRWYPTMEKGRTYYKNFWWGIEQEKQANDIYAMGILGQFIYVSTDNDVVIVRQGNSWGVEGWWPAIFEELAQKVK